jgi:hypothetical protein
MAEPKQGEPKQEQTEDRVGREGGRWLNARPTPAEFAEWFETNMKIDPALNALDYVGGVVLIPAVDTKSKYVTGFRNGKPIIEEREELAFIPYAKVETRINYFWDLIAAHHEDWVAFVEHVDLERLPVVIEAAVQTIEEEGKTTTTERPGRPDAMTSMVHQLPKGFSIAAIPVGEGFTYFLCCTTLVEIYDAAKLAAALEKAYEMLAAAGHGAKLDEAMSIARKLTPPLRRGSATKQVPLLKGGYGSRQPYADDSSLMKAETGALGRALGFAGIFVIPGSGVATAEDMQESLSQGQTVSQAPQAEADAGPSTPEAAPARTGAEQAQDDETKLAAQAAALWKTLSEDFPAKATEFGTWARTRHLASLHDAKGAMLRGVVRKLETLVDQAKHEQQERLVQPTLESAVAEPEVEAGGETVAAPAEEEPSPAAE